MKTRLIITGLAFFAMTSLAFPQNGQTQERTARNQANCPSWSDENKNGVCDKFENRTQGQGRKSNGTGYCSGGNQEQGKGMMNGNRGGNNFIDADKNGICDRYEKTDQQKK